MIRRIDLNYFKCFKKLRLPLSPLTMLSGTNATGKSSVLQALVLLHQTIVEQEWSTRLHLNGKSIRLGTVADVVDKVNSRELFEIGIIDDSDTYFWSFRGGRSDMAMKVEQVAISDKIFSRPEQLHYMLPSNIDITGLASQLRRLSYITAERVGPREVYSLEDMESTTTVGTAGEYAASVLHGGRDENVLDELCLSDAPPTRLRQVEARMNSFFPGCTLNLQQIPQANAVTLGIRTSNDTDFHRPVHVGFGLTQVLPIVIAALSASKGDLLLIENPEVHLHPAGQAMMGRFLSEVASAGVQVIIETHSDHILNGIRRSVKENEISNKDVSIHFFCQRSEDAPQVISPQIDPDGNIDSWPDGFFDQFDKDANYFAGWE
ncbi:MAG: DUF3696 domain-containing protein [Deltaproteobacteria bacterium]|nr:DUF3696 domain-containing protein [Deltaproteobacteria bacterium]